MREFLCILGANVCKMVRPVLSDRCLSVCLSVCLPVCLSVTLMYCGQTVGWIRMPFGMEVGLIPGHIVLDGDPAPPEGAQQPRPLFSPCLLYPNGWLDQDATWMEVDLGQGHILLDGDAAFLPHCQRSTAAPSTFRPVSIVAKRLDGSRCHLVRR